MDMQLNNYINYTVTACACVISYEPTSEICKKI